LAWSSRSTTSVVEAPFTTKLAEASTQLGEAVTALLLEAHAVAEGTLSGLGQLASVVEQVQRLRDAGVGDDGLDLRLTPLDPRRPAPDMLEDLLTAIDGCFLLWRESSDVPDGADVVDDEIDDAVAEDHDGGGDGEGDSEATESLDGEDVLGLDRVDDDDEDDGEGWYAAAADRFCEDLRRAMHVVGSPA
jgi:hypothetical protein